MKKIALASAAMGGAALLAFGASGTFAAFQDTEQATAFAGAGTLDLTVKGGSVAPPVISMALNPGQSTAHAYWLTNAGSLAGVLDVTTAILENAENGCTVPEAVLDKTCTLGASDGDFSGLATAQFLINKAVDEAACRVATTGAGIVGLPARTLDEWAANPARLVRMNPGTSTCMVVQVTLPAAVGNVVQGDTAKFRTDLTLTQFTQAEVTPPIASIPPVIALPGTVPSALAPQANN